MNNHVAQMNAAWQTLRQRWEAAIAVWNDPVRWQFEREHWQPLSGHVFAATREMERVAHVITQARQSVR